RRRRRPGRGRDRDPRRLEARAHAAREQRREVRQRARGEQRIDGAEARAVPADDEQFGATLGRRGQRSRALAAGAERGEEQGRERDPAHAEAGTIAGARGGRARPQDPAPQATKVFLGSPVAMDKSLETLRAGLDWCLHDNTGRACAVGLLLFYLLVWWR